ncbi:DUF1937 family protein [Rhizobium miluonense]|uniref:DUF1937 domain-containing protein n=1 Tax=Rhizobium miluonense TaxID=411945 RepID=A0A1C3WCQ5_9HYPH|nr:DUF1937 family protein [Rhizobium miluonense]SCB37927.1 protein of unknown function [Rhizobium miluonense]
MRKIFLACPYGHADKTVVEQRFEISNAVAAAIARSGSVVFSQVSMSHPINKHLSDLDKAGIGNLWAPIDQVFMDAMDELIVIDEVGWKESAGVAREIEFFKIRNRRVSLWSEVTSEFSA